MSGNNASIIGRSDWASGGSLHGEIEGKNHDVGISIIINDLNGPGRGPDLHRHDYAETIVVTAGRAMATIGSEARVIASGDIVFIPAGVVHAFKSMPGKAFRAVDIHESNHFATKWIDKVPAPKRSGGV